MKNTKPKTHREEKNEYYKHLSEEDCRENFRQADREIKSLLKIKPKKHQTTKADEEFLACIFGIGKITKSGHQQSQKQK